MPESLKNILLVMSSSGFLVPPSQDPSKAELWNGTWKRIDRFLPDLRKELDLEQHLRAGHDGDVEAQSEKTDVSATLAATDVEGAKEDLQKET